MPTFLLLLGALGLLLGAAAAVRSVRHSEVGFVKVALCFGLVLVTLAEGNQSHNQQRLDIYEALH